jgi:hypothetical protein
MRVQPLPQLNVAAYRMLVKSPPLQAMDQVRKHGGCCPVLLSPPEQVGESLVQAWISYEEVSGWFGQESSFDAPYPEGALLHFSQVE